MKQIMLFSMLAVFSFDTEQQCEEAAKHFHKHEYVEGGCWKSFEYVMEAPLPRPKDLFKSVSGGRE